MNEESNYEKIRQTTLPKQLADEHWEFLQRWMEMIFKDGFIHGYKHGLEDTLIHGFKHGVESVPDHQLSHDKQIGR